MKLVIEIDLDAASLQTARGASDVLQDAALRFHSALPLDADDRGEFRDDAGVEVATWRVRDDFGARTLV